MSKNSRMSINIKNKEWCQRSSQVLETQEMDTIKRWRREQEKLAVNGILKEDLGESRVAAVH